MNISPQSQTHETNSNSLISIGYNNNVNLEGGKIIFLLGVSGAVATAAIALYFAMR